MYFTDLKQLAPDAAEFGINVARTMRIISKLLLDWSTANCARRNVNKNTNSNNGEEKLIGKLPCLTAIYFDKLVMFYCRIWDELHDSDETEYRTAFIKNPGIHGQGQTLKINRTADEKIGMGKNPDDYRISENAFITEIVEKLRTSIGDDQALFRLEGESWDFNCRIYPQLTGSSWDLWIKDQDFMNAKDLAYLSIISSNIASLSKHEIRAIGTHCSPRETCEDIEFNLYEIWEKSFNTILEILVGNNHGRIDNFIHRLKTTSREIINKSSDNRKKYKDAYEKFIGRIVYNSPIDKVFRKIQESASSIWEDDSVKKYRKISPILFGFSLYCKKVLNILGIVKKLEDKELKDMESFYIKLKDWTDDIPITLFDYESINDKPKSEIVIMLKTVKEKIMIEMPIKEAIKNAGIL